MAGQSIRTAENLSKLTKLTGTTLSLGASRINIGALQWVTSTLTLNTAVVGLGGVDATLAVSSLYYCYAVVSSGTAYLIASLSATAPTGYAQCRMVGAFYSNASSQINDAIPLKQGAIVTEWQNFTANFAGQTGGTKTGKWRRIGDSMEIEATVVSPSAWGVYQNLTMPAGYTINIASLTTGVTVVGTAITRVANSSFVYPGVAVVASSTTIQPGGGGSQVDFWAASISSPSAYTSNQGSTSIHATVPIVEWAGSVVSWPVV